MEVLHKTRKILEKMLKCESASTFTEHKSKYRILIYARIFRNIPDQLEIFSYYSGIFYKTLELLIYNHVIIHI